MKIRIAFKRIGKGILNFLERILKIIKEIPGLMGEKPILTALIFLIIIGFVVFRISISAKQEGKEFTGNIIAEGYGVVFDIFVFGILIAFFNRLGEKRRDIKRWKEEIEDFRLWENEEAKFRIVGNIIRLNKAGVYNIDLSSCYLQKAILWSANLNGADLWKANLKEAYLAHANLKVANLWKANLEGTYLGAANLWGAFLVCANLNEAYLGETDLLEANLGGAILIGTDLRKATNLSLDQLSKAKTLFRAKLDPELEAQVKEKFPRLLEEPKEDG